MATNPALVANALAPAAEGPGSILRLRATGAAELRRAVRKGLPFSAFEAMSKHLDVSPKHITTVLGIPPRTVARRKAAKYLTPQESDRLYRLARAVAQAVEVLGTIDKARVWL